MILLRWSNQLNCRYEVLNNEVHASIRSFSVHILFLWPRSNVFRWCLNWRVGAPVGCWEWKCTIYWTKIVCIGYGNTTKGISVFINNIRVILLRNLHKTMKIMASWSILIIEIHNKPRNVLYIWEKRQQQTSSRRAQVASEDPTVGAIIPYKRCIKMIWILACLSITITTSNNLNMQILRGVEILSWRVESETTRKQNQKQKQDWKKVEGACVQASVNILDGNTNGNDHEENQSQR